MSHADRRELAREMRGVGVDREAEQQLVADRDDFDARVVRSRVQSARGHLRGARRRRRAEAAQVEHERIEREQHGADHRRACRRCR